MSIKPVATVNLRIFQEDELFEALMCSARRGVCVYLNSLPFGKPDKTGRFVGQKKGSFGLLLCRDKDRLVRVAYSLGVKRPVVMFENGDGQGVQISGMPLRVAIALSRMTADQPAE